jgi:hypothetical protein
MPREEQGQEFWMVGDKGGINEKLRAVFLSSSSLSNCMGTV